MNYLKLYCIVSFVSLTVVMTCFTTNAQRTARDSADYLSVPGPANQDTVRFATFYITRPDNEVAKRFWLGIYFDDTLMVRVDNNMRSVVKYAKMGNINIWAKNTIRSAVTVNVEPGKKYYLKMEMEPGGDAGNPKLSQLEEKEGKEAFDQIQSPPMYVYDPDPFTNSKYIYPSSFKTGFQHMIFSLPLSTRHYFASANTGFMFSYYNKMVSATFSEIDGVYGGRKNLSDKEEFQNFFNKQINSLKKGLKKSETLQAITPDSLTSQADYISGVYFVTHDSKPDVLINGIHPVLELRQYSILLYKKDPATGKGDYYSVYFSERGLPEELHTKEEIRFKAQRLVTSCEFGDFK